MRVAECRRTLLDGDNEIQLLKLALDASQQESLSKDRIISERKASMHKMSKEAQRNQRECNRLLAEQREANILEAEEADKKVAAAKRDRDSKVSKSKNKAAAQVLLSIRDRDSKIEEALLDKRRVLQAERQYCHDRRKETTAKVNSKLFDERVNQGNLIAKMERKHEEQVANYQIDASNSKLTIQAQVNELSLLRIKAKSDTCDKQRLYSAQIQDKEESIKRLEKEYGSNVDVLITTCKQLVSAFATATEDASKSNMAAADSEATASCRLEKVRECQDKISELRDQLISESRERYKLALDNEVLEMTMQEMKDDYKKRLRDLTPRIIARDWNKKGAWPNWVTQLVVELLSHRTPPSCVSANIISVLSLVCPNSINNGKNPFLIIKYISHQINHHTNTFCFLSFMEQDKTNLAKDMPGVSFIRDCRSILVMMTKTLAAHHIAGLESHDQLHTDGTDRRQTEFENLVVGYMSDSGYKTVVLDATIVPDGKTAEHLHASILRTFKEAGGLLDDWRAVTADMYKDDPALPSLLAEIPESTELRLSKFNNATVSTDTCNTARKMRLMLIDSVTQLCKDEGVEEKNIKLFVGDCWHHLRCIWIGAGLKHLDTYLTDLVPEVNDIHFLLRISTSIEKHLIAIEKEFGATANYAKGHGGRFIAWMKRYHPGALLFPVLRVTAGARQDSGTEGAIVAFMNRKYYIQFLNQDLSAKTKDHSILQKNLYIVLRSLEMIASFRMLSIIHVAIVLPHRWLAGNAHLLSNENFGITDMAEVAELIDNGLQEISSNGELILDQDFMMGILKPIQDKVPTFKSYMEFMFELHTCYAVGSRDEVDKKLIYDELLAELFYPVRQENIDTNELTIRLAEEFALVTYTDMERKDKATAAYIGEGVRSVRNVSEEDKQIQLGRSANNSISESCHASATEGLAQFGMIRLDYSGAMGQSRVNNDFGRGHEAYASRGKMKQVTNKRKGTVEKKEIELGSFHMLHPKLQDSLLQTSRKNAKKHGARFDAALKRQEDLKREKMELLLAKKLEDKGSNFLENLYLWDQWHHEKCWHTKEEANDQFKALTSKTAKLKAVKDQLLIRYLGLGWVEAYHPWSRNGTDFSPDYLFKFLVDVVIPLKDEKVVPDEPPVDLPAPPEMPTLGTTSCDADGFDENYNERVETFKQKWRSERDSRMERGEGDKWSKMQKDAPPKIDSSLKNYEIEMLFSGTDDAGEPFFNWYNGKVKKVLNEKGRRVLIEWNEDCLGTEDARESKQRLAITKWNPENSSEGAWRHYIKE